MNKTVIKAVSFNNSVLVAGKNGESELIEQSYSCTIEREETTHSETGLVWVVTRSIPGNVIVNRWDSYAVALMDMRSYVTNYISKNLQ